MERNVERTPTSDLVAMTKMIYAIPLPQNLYGISVTAMPGLGELSRIQHAINLAHRSGEHFFPAGSNASEETHIELNLCVLQRHPFNLDVNRVKKVICQGTALHTKEQTEWIVEQAKILGIKRLILSVTPFHMLRAYATLVSSILSREMDLVVWPALVPISPDEIVPEVEMSAWDMVPGEVQRIPQYQDKGDVATCFQIVEYLTRHKSQLFPFLV